MSESRVITVNAYIQVLDEEFECHCDLRKKTTLLPQLRRECENEFRRLDELSTKAESANDAHTTKHLRDIKQSATYVDIKENLAAAEGILLQQKSAKKGFWN